MDMGKILLAALSGANTTVEQDIKRLDFYMAEKMPWELFLDLNEESKKLELLQKSYILAVLRDDKEKRLHILKTIKEASAHVPEMLKHFRKSYKNHQKHCKAHKNETCKDSE